MPLQSPTSVQPTDTIFKYLSNGERYVSREAVVKFIDSPELGLSNLEKEAVTMNLENVADDDEITDIEFAKIFSVEVHEGTDTVESNPCGELLLYFGIACCCCTCGLSCVPFCCWSTCFAPKKMEDSIKGKLFMFNMAKCTGESKNDVALEESAKVEA
eukprot:CAMPEP_0170186640 /NCGR_PEP_ID=MMETSP0040_2-20121228/39805_1 /TAXON_ID=641309 /ORGANISM="Lotharella oceanica, Strain CCMP622" /LENGTH=157 /DNA_ID=CAMNT_0010433465 /DNA_START=115 /DNA_END=588 /DNA_ORIENTATION=-